ncbi:type II toxin-antitoxin system RelE/ParE family toxin [candidate division KSB1 bacterium]|nr:type II toxin-antitoxin system RelE/ParE family toxin [candidate division KSB1 bacterium]
MKDRALLQEVKSVVEEVEQAASLSLVKNIKQLRGGGNYFRIQIGDYRLGLRLEDDTVFFVRFLHRKEIYRYFP